MSFTWWDKIPWNEQLSKETAYPQSYTCRKKKGVACRFNAPWAPSNKTRIVFSEEKIDETILKQSKELIDKII